MSERSDIEKLKTRAADLRKIAAKSNTKIGRHFAERMAAEADRAASKAEAEQGHHALNHQGRLAPIARTQSTGGFGPF